MKWASYVSDILISCAITLTLENALVPGIGYAPLAILIAACALVVAASLTLRGRNPRVVGQIVIGLLYLAVLLDRYGFATGLGALIAYVPFGLRRWLDVAGNLDDASEHHRFIADILLAAFVILTSLMTPSLQVASWIIAALALLVRIAALHLNERRVADVRTSIAGRTYAWVGLGALAVAALVVLFIAFPALDAWLFYLVFAAIVVVLFANRGRALMVLGMASILLVLYLLAQLPKGKPMSPKGKVMGGAKVHLKGLPPLGSMRPPWEFELIGVLVVIALIIAMLRFVSKHRDTARKQSSPNVERRRLGRTSGPRARTDIARLFALWRRSVESRLPIPVSNPTASQLLQAAERYGQLQSDETVVSRELVALYEEERYGLAQTDPTRIERIKGRLKKDGMTQRPRRRP
jgi:hypothetical protein